MTKVRAKHLLSSSRMPPDSLPSHIEAEDGKSGILLPTARISSNIRIQTDAKGWDFMFRLNGG